MSFYFVGTRLVYRKCMLFNKEIIFVGSFMGLYMDREASSSPHDLYAHSTVFAQCFLIVISCCFADRHA